MNYCLKSKTIRKTNGISLGRNEAIFLEKNKKKTAFSQMINSVSITGTPHSVKELKNYEWNENKYNTLTDECNLCRSIHRLFATQSLTLSLTYTRIALLRP